MEKLDDCYAYLGRTPRRQEQEMLLAVWEELSEKLFVEHVGEQSGKGGMRAMSFLSLCGGTLQRSISG